MGENEDMEFIKGMDVSMAKELEEYGAEYYLDGKKEDLFFILKHYGTNMIRLRIWVDPYDGNGNSYGGGGNDLETTISLAKRIQQCGMKLMLDFHYSDFWADPGRQLKPKAWEQLSGKELETAVYLHTRNVLKSLKNHRLEPYMVQIGNEITNGILWPDGHIGTTDLEYRNYEGADDDHNRKLSRLLKAGILASREEFPQAKIVLHLDFGTDNEMYRRWFDKLLPYEMDYDVIGMSYYPQWNGSVERLFANMNDVSIRYNKDVMIVETSIGYTTDSLGCKGSIYSEETAIKAGYPATQDGQKMFMKDLCAAVRKVKDNRGIGLCYWEPAWLPIKGCNWATPIGSAYMHDRTEPGNAMANQSLFNQNGYPNLALLHLREL